jgi:hypothetical protein
MDRESMTRLRLDRRLIRRRSWISQEELTRELEALPDVAHKASRGEEAPTPAPPDAAVPGVPEAD